MVFNYFLTIHLIPSGSVAQAVVSVSKPLTQQPVIIALSSTGILSTKDLLPMPLKPLYRGLLHKPHVDKIEMENAIADEYIPEKWILVRGALYTDGARTGVYRVGETEVGYTIRRSDVADFIVNQCIDGDGKWLGKRPVVVY
jgi:NAD(P)H-binding